MSYQQCWVMWLQKVKCLRWTFFKVLPLSELDGEFCVWWKILCGEKNEGKKVRRTRLQVQTKVEECSIPESAEQVVAALEGGHEDGTGDDFWKTQAPSQEEETQQSVLLWQHCRRIFSALVSSHLMRLIKLQAYASCNNKIILCSNFDRKRF